MRLANATTGEEHEAHMRAIEKMILKYNLVVPDNRLITEKEKHADYTDSLRYAMESKGAVRRTRLQRIIRAIKRFFVKYF